MDVKVWLGKEGTNDAGALEALLRRIEAKGWRVDGGTAWKDIRKYKAGGARHDSHHADVQNVKGEAEAKRLLAALAASLAQHELVEASLDLERSTLP